MFALELGGMNQINSDYAGRFHHCSETLLPHLQLIRYKTADFTNDKFVMCTARGTMHRSWPQQVGISFTL